MGKLREITFTSPCTEVKLGAGDATRTRHVGQAGALIREPGAVHEPVLTHAGARERRLAARLCSAGAAVSTRLARGRWVFPLLLLLGGCRGPQSALDPAGVEAAEIATLFWWMTAGTVLIWLGVLALAVYAVRVHPEQGKRCEKLLIVFLGAVFPTVVLTGLLMYGLSLIPRQVALAPNGALKVEVDGERWWWRVRYPRVGGGYVESANEVRLPVGEPVQFDLRSSNVIHAFWIPSLGGKKDMIPGRVTHLALRPERTGVFRGACAEYCGESHALMALYAVVVSREEFDSWLERESRDAREPATPLAITGRKQFLQNGCGACHTIRGTPARGVIGPDLTHVGGRISIGAGILPTTRESLVHWITRVHQVKPGVLMPHFGMLPDEDVAAIAAYLGDLK